MLIGNIQTFMEHNKPGIFIKGKTVDNHTRCVHYHSPLDVIAIKFKCCQDYYPCYACHQEAAGHSAAVWPAAEFNHKAILCGMCGHELSINEYRNSNNECPQCRAAFNPGCAKHYHLYFDVPACDLG